jgi:hypothetical protein
MIIGYNVINNVKKKIAYKKKALLLRRGKFGCLQPQ